MQLSEFKALPVLFFWFAYFILIEFSFGATLGHKAMGLKIVSINSHSISLGQSIKRHLIDPIDFSMFGIPAMIAIKNSDKHQRIGDMWANTIVIENINSENS